MPEDKEKIHSEESYMILGISMKVLNEVGHGFHEKIYENGIAVGL